jgi:hypothetical protein
MTINWSDVKSQSIRDAFRVALDDHYLSHAEVVEVLRAAMSDGILSEQEIDDLVSVANTSETIMPRSKAMLLYLRKAADRVFGYGTINVSTGRQKAAADIIFDFMKRMGSPYFPKLDRDKVGIDLLLRVSNPNILNQRSAGICGPVAFLYAIAFDSPTAYARYAIDLYEKGKAKFGDLDITPSSDCRQYDPPDPMSPADWLTAASLRDSENFWFNFSSMDDGDSSTSLGEMSKWFERAGYSDIHSENNLFYSLKQSDIDAVNRYYAAGYRIVLRIHSKMLDAATQYDKSSKGNHVVVLRTPITVTGNSISLKVYTWGNILRPIPASNTQMTPSAFLENWYGYIAAKPY